MPVDKSASDGYDGGMDKLYATVERPLTQLDLDQPPEKAVTKAPALKRITDRHHQLARCLADGASPSEAAAACDYSQSRISILLDDPSFKHLVAMYRDQVAARYVKLHDKLAEVAGASADELSERLDTTPEEFSTNELVSLVKLGADRTGHGPQTQHNVSGHIDIGARLDAARKRLQDADDAEIINE